MATYCTIHNKKSGAVILRRAEWRKHFWGHFTGLMLRRHLPDDEGLLFDYGHDSVLQTSIHMLFMFFPIATIWINNDHVVVDKVLAKPWRPSYVPRKPARYFIEARPLLLETVEIGDTLRFDDMA
jgi:hypothetical protein